MTQTSSQAVSPVPVPFYGDTLFLIEKDGVPMTPLRPIVENIGLQWRGQWEKVTADAKRWGGVGIYIPSSGGPQEMLCIPVRKLPAFLFSISPNKVPEEKREKLIKYQEECDDALWNYWTKGQAMNPRAEPVYEYGIRPVAPEIAKLQRENLDYRLAVEKKAMMLERLLHAANPLYHDIFRYRVMGLAYSEIARLVDKTEEFVKQALKSRCSHVHNQRWNARGPLGRHHHPTLENE